VWIVVNFSLDLVFLSSFQWISRDQRRVVFLLRWLNANVTSSPPFARHVSCVIGGRHSAIFNFEKMYKKSHDECISRRRIYTGDKWGGGFLRRPVGVIMSLMKPMDSVSYTSKLTFIFGPDWTEQDVKFQASDDRVRGGSSKVRFFFLLQAES